MERIVVGVDRSAASLVAATWASSLAEPAGVELLAVEAVRELGEGSDGRRAAERELAEWCWAVPRAVPEVVEGETVDALLQIAGTAGADLLVVGSRGAGGFALLRIGSVAHHLAQVATVPLAVVPPGLADPAVEHLVIGLDGSAASLAAVTFCADAAKAAGLSVTALLAHEPFLEWVPESDRSSWHRAAEKKVQEWSAPMVDAGVEVDVVIDRDVHPVAALLRASEARPRSTLVVGARGAGGFPRLRLGRVASQLLHEAEVPVVVVRHGEER